MTSSIIANDRNLVRTATLTASTQRASADVRAASVVREGGGRLSVSGAYTGAADTAIEAEITSGSGTALRPSAPTLAGVGSGALTVLAVDVAAVPETWSVRLVSTGTPATYAELPFFGVTLIAQTIGAPGNALTLSVERRLTLTDTEYATLTGIPAGTADLDGPQWDFGAAAAVDDQVPLDAPRIAFGDSPQVHRHWRTWEDGRWVYHLDPPPSAAIGADTRVRSVAGDYRLTISDGVDAETYDAVTLYDALRQIAARSELVSVSGVVAADRAPGGMAVTDIPLRTDAYAMPVEAEIQTPWAGGSLDAITVDSAAPTETLTIERLASGRWSVQGSVSGVLAEARTAVPYAAAGVAAFTIPVATVPEADRAAIDTRVTLEQRGPDETVPQICVHPRVGVAATPKTITFRYTRRPTSECSCASLPAPYVSDACLGLVEEEDTMSLPAEVASRVAAVYSWREGWLRANTRWVPGADAKTETEGGTPAVQGQYQLVANATLNWTDDQYGSYSGTITARSTSVYTTAAAAQEIAEEVGGYQGAALIGFPTSIRLAGHLFAVTQWPSGPTGFSTSWLTGTETWSCGVLTVVEAVSEVPGTSIEVPAVLAGWEGASSEIAAMDAVLNILLPCLAEVYADADALSGWDALWAEASAELDLRTLTTSGEDARLRNADWLRRYQAATDNLRILAGIYPSFEVASSDAGACWRDDTSAVFWWEDVDGVYLPAFTGRGYTSAKRVDGVVTNTQEFGFGLAVGCEGSLKEGDSVIIIVRGATLDGYLVGDTFRLPIIAAAPAPWSGGQAGDDTHTWTVRGSVSGAAPDWSWSPSDPTDYTAGLVSLRLTPGGIAHAVGDNWSVLLEGGEVRWRRDGGDWETADLYGGDIDLGDGLTLSAAGGVAPSWVAGDAWSWDALATYGAGQLVAPVEGAAWSWDGAGAVLDLDLGAVAPIGALLLALHTLPSGAGIAVSGGDAAIGEWTAAPTWREGPILHVLPAETTARYLRITLSGCGTGASIGWLWAGVPWTPASAPSSMDHVRQYGLTRGAGRNPRAIYRGRGMGGRWGWSLDAGGALFDADIEGLLALLDHVAAEGLEWVCLVPDESVPASATLAQIDADEVAITEHLGYRHGAAKVHSVDLPFRAVLS